VLGGRAAAQVAGVEAAIWAETISDFDDLSLSLLPRLPRVAYKARSEPRVARGSQWTPGGKIGGVPGGQVGEGGGDGVDVEVGEPFQPVELDVVDPSAASSNSSLTPGGPGPIVAGWQSQQRCLPASPRNLQRSWATIF
jgi:hypothetical protein